LPPSPRGGERGGGVVQWFDAGDQRVGRHGVATERFDGGGVALALVDPGAHHGELPPEELEQVDLTPLVVDAPDDEATADRKQPDGHVEAGRRTGDLEHHGDTGAAGAGLDFAGHTVIRRVERTQAQGVGDGTPVWIEFEDDHVGPDRSRHQSDQHADRVGCNFAVEFLR
jgi:hypothetical protein